MANARDTRFFVVCAVAFLLGVALLAGGAWELVFDQNAPNSRGEGGLLGGGVVLVGISIYEFVRRLRSGPEKPGRHSKA